MIISSQIGSNMVMKRPTGNPEELGMDSTEQTLRRGFQHKHTHSAGTRNAVQYQTATVLIILRNLTQCMLVQCTIIPIDQVKLKINSLSSQKKVHPIIDSVWTRWMNDFFSMTVNEVKNSLNK